MGKGEPQAQNEPIGHHWLVELYDCPSGVLETVDAIETAMLEGAKAMGATIIQSSFHQFAPIGVSGVIIIQESHLTIHTWPEFGYAALDLFTCGKSLQPQQGLEYLKNTLQAGRMEVKYVERGKRD